MYIMVLMILILVLFCIFMEYFLMVWIIMMEWLELCSVLYWWVRCWIMWLIWIYRWVCFGCMDIIWDSMLMGWDFVSFCWLIMIIFKLMWNSFSNWILKCYRLFGWFDLGWWLYFGSFWLVLLLIFGFVD